MSKSTSFSPLFIGASRSTDVDQDTLRLRHGVSVPSSLGHRVQLLCPDFPLDRNKVSVPSSLGHRVQPSMLPSTSTKPREFQSPLHWGIAFNNQCTSQDTESGEFLIPLI